jgi:DNA-binding Xre family transcriptional regulator
MELVSVGGTRYVRGMDTQTATSDGLRAALRHLNKRRTEMAQIIGVKPTTVNSKFANQSRWSLDEILKIAAWLDVQPFDLVRGEEHATAAIAWKLDQEAQKRKAIESVRQDSTPVTA